MSEPHYGELWEQLERKRKADMSETIAEIRARHEYIEAICAGCRTMNREDVKQTMLLAMSEHHSGTLTEAQRIVDAQIAAIEAAGVRLVPVNEKPGQGWLHEAVKDACLRASKNSGGTPPQLLYAPILWAMQDALAASPYATGDAP